MDINYKKAAEQGYTPNNCIVLMMRTLEKAELHGIDTEEFWRLAIKLSWRKRFHLIKDERAFEKLFLVFNKIAESVDDSLVIKRDFNQVLGSFANVLLDEE